MNKITQEMKYRQSIIKFAFTYGVSKASRKYDKARSYVYFWLNRYDGNLSSLASRSRRPKHHPNQHAAEELGLIRRMHKRNRNTGLYEFWFKLKAKGYQRSLNSLYRVMRREGLIAGKRAAEKKLSQRYTKPCSIPVNECRLT